MYFKKLLYILFLILSLNLSFFSTNIVNANTFFIDDIEISEKLENNFNKEILINRGFEKAFNELISKLVQSKDLSKINDIKLNEIKSMIETFSIKEEKFINKTYNLNLGVSFNKRYVLNYLYKKNIFPSQIKEEKFLFIPILLDQLKNDILVYSKNPLYNNWKAENSRNQLIEYILPTEDLEDLNLIRKNHLEIENYDFEKIIEKYFIKNSIIAVFFKNQNEIKVLSKITIQNKKVIKTNSFKNIDLNKDNDLEKLIYNLKVVYEDFWKENNLINTSIKLPIMIHLDNKNFELSLKFEKALNSIDFINNFTIRKFDKDFILYEIIFNGTPQNFIDIMEEQNFSLDTQNKIWILK